MFGNGEERRKEKIINHLFDLQRKKRKEKKILYL